MCDVVLYVELPHINPEDMKTLLISICTIKRLHTDTQNLTE